MSRCLTLVAFAILATTPALADRADADNCAKNLSPIATNIYNAGIERVSGGSTLEQGVRPYLEPLVQSKQMTEADARKYGREAAECMRLVHRKETLPPQ